MGAMTTLRELVTFWPTLTAEERLDYRVRFGDDVYEVISIQETDSGDRSGVEPTVEVRGYQLNGPMAQTQRDANSRAARVRVFPLNLGGVEILDHDEPIERDDPPPPNVRLSPEGEYERIQPDLGDSTKQMAEAQLRNLEDQMRVPDEREAARQEFMREQVEYAMSTPIAYPEPIVTYPSNWAGDPEAAPKPPSALDIPVDDWASTAVRLPHSLLDRLSKTAKQRMIGRNILLAHIVEQGLNDLDNRPVV